MQPGFQWSWLVLGFSDVFFSSPPWLRCNSSFTTCKVERERFKKKKGMCRLSPWVWGINVKSVRKGINRLNRCLEPGQSWAMIPEVAEHDLHTANAVVQNTLLFLQCVGWPGSRSCCRGALGKAEPFQCCLEKAQASPFSPPSFSRVFLDCCYAQELSSHCCPPVLECTQGTPEYGIRDSRATANAGSSRALSFLFQYSQELPSTQWSRLPLGVSTGSGNRSFPPFTPALSLLFTINLLVRLHLGLISFYRVRWLVLPHPGRK